MTQTGEAVRPAQAALSKTAQRADPRFLQQAIGLGQLAVANGHVPYRTRWKTPLGAPDGAGTTRSDRRKLKKPVFWLPPPAKARTVPAPEKSAL